MRRINGSAIYEPLYPDMKILSVYPSDNVKLAASNEVIQFALKTFTKYNFTLTEVRGCINTIYNLRVSQIMPFVMMM